MSQQSQYRRVVNRSLGKNPKIGPFPANQIIPLLVVMVLSYFIKAMFHLTWVETALFAGWLMGTSWVIVGERPWRFFSRFSDAPRLTRGGARYQSLLSPADKEEPSDRRRSTRKGSTRGSSRH